MIKLETQNHYLNNSSWASCASLDRILVRESENLKRLVLHFHFINLIHRISNLLFFWENLQLQIFIVIKLTASWGNNLKINLLHLVGIL